MDPRGRASLTFIIAFALVAPAISSHFKGAYITWRAVDPEQFDGRIEITHQVAWRGNSGSRSCSDTTIAQHTMVAGEGNLVCQSGCSGVLGNMSFYCTIRSSSDNWVAGKRSYVANVGKTLSKFEASFASGNWITLYTGSSDNWEVRVKGDLRVRIDTGKINTPPTTSNLPVIHLQYNHPQTIIIPVEDADGDVVQCRWAESSQEECADVCSDFSYATLHENCTMTYNGGGGTGWHAVAVQIEDYPSTWSTIPLSSVPLQFVVKIVSGSISAPTFVSSTLNHRARINVNRTSQFVTRITAQSGSSSTTITSIETATITPFELSKSVLQHISGTRMWYIDVKWTPSPYETDPQVFCFQAFDSRFQTSETRCITLVPTGDVPPELKLMWICHNNILLKWNLKDAIGNRVEKFKLTTYTFKGNQPTEMYSINLEPKRRLHNFLRREPNNEYMFTLQMMLQGETQYKTLGSLRVNGECPDGEECCTFFKE